MYNLKMEIEKAQKLYSIKKDDTEKLDKFLTFLGNNSNKNVKKITLTIRENTLPSIEKTPIVVNDLIINNKLIIKEQPPPIKLMIKLKNLAEDREKKPVTLDIRTIVKVGNHEIILDTTEKLTLKQAAVIRSKYVVNNYPKVAKYTRTIFIERSMLIHPGQFNYDIIKDEDVKNKSSKVILICKFCEIGEFPVEISQHIAGSGCLRCNGSEKWDYKKFKFYCDKTHGANFNYDLISEKDITCVKSEITIVCNTCGYKDKTNVFNHLGNKSSCLWCCGKCPWSLERFLVEAVLVHWMDYDYSLVKEEHIMAYDSHVPIICNQCNGVFQQRIYHHMRGHGCSDCNR